MSIPRFFARQSVMVNMLVLAVLVAGLLAIHRMPMEDTPAIDMDSMLIIVPYLGATPDDIEKLITLPIEEQIKNLPDIDFINAYSSEGRSVIFIQYEVGLDDFNQTIMDLKEEVDKVKPDLPEEAREDLFYIKISTNELWPVINFAMAGDYSIEGMNEVADALKDALMAEKDIVKVEIYGTRKREIWVEVDRTKITASGISIMAVNSALQTANINLPAGRVEMGKEEFLVRAMGEVTDPVEIGNIVVKAGADGKVVKVKDVAKVIDTFNRDEVISRLNGVNSVSVRVFMNKDGSIVDVSDRARRVAKEFARTTADVRIKVRNDRSKEVRDSINVLTTNAMSGLILVAILMTITIGLRSAILAIIGIPFSFLIAFVFLEVTGNTINSLSLFAFILVLGMIVDDAIIIIENVYRHMEEGKSPVQAAIDGSEQVMWPVIAAILTTIAAFLPLLMMSGVIGKFMSVMPIVVALALAGSLLESIVVLPSHLADFGKLPKAKNGERLGEKIFRKLEWLYKKQVNGILNWKYLVTLCTIVLTVVSIIVAAKVLRVEMFAKENVDTERLIVKMQMGTKIEETDKMVKLIEQKLSDIPENEIVYTAATVGLVIENQQWIFRGDGAMITFEFGEEDQRRTNDELKQAIRDRIKDIPELKAAYFTTTGHGPPTGTPVELRVLGDNLDKMRMISEMIADDMKAKEGIVDVEVGYSEGKKELRFIPDRVKMSTYGISMYQVSSILRTAVGGNEATKFRDDKGDEIEVIVKYKENDRNDIDDLKQLIISNNTGMHVPLSELGEFEIKRGMAAISRYNAKRSITITANVNDKQINSQEANKYIKEKFKDLSLQYPGYRLEFGGEKQEMDESFASLGQAFLVALLIVFLILATQFQSFTQPFVVMFTVPFSILGVAVGLIVMDLNFSLVAGISVVALAGVVVNDSLVLVDFVNKARAAGLQRREALIVSGARRMRPILLTTITTIAGLMPMALGLGGSSLTWKPMAICVIWGLAFATFLTLFIIPCAYSMLDDWNNFFRKKVGMKTTGDALRSRAEELKDETVLVDL